MRELTTADTPGTLNVGIALGRALEANMARIWNKHKSNTPFKPKVFVAMSGGVDSSVAAHLLKRQGYDVTGVFMRSYNIDGCEERDAEDARRTAEHIGIPFYVWNFEKEYKKKVVAYMIEGYRAGITPNPDVMCNKEIKFGLFLARALKMGADYIATGHYVRLWRTETKNEKRERRGKPHLSSPPAGLPTSGGQAGLISHLYAAKDQSKDQSYFLWTLTQRQLAHCLFPIGGYLKPDVRAIARMAKLPTADKKDSQGICFLGNVPIADFLRRYIPEKKGDVVTADGTIIGAHAGARFYTIGQRHLGLSAKRNVQNAKRGGRNKTWDTKPFYVTEKDVKRNVLVVAEGNDNPALFRKEMRLSDVNLIRPLAKRKNVGVVARVRYRQPLAAAQLAWRKSRIILTFDTPVKFVAPGQSAVFYLPANVSTKAGAKSFEMLGGGIIV